MATVNLNDYIPEGRDGSKSLLPKQQYFYSQMLNANPKSPKFGAYIGGIGSGKSVIGCIIMRDMAVREAGDYLICRQFSPELRITTYKTFLDLLPKELILEHRVADAMVKIKAINGVSNVYFRPLEDPDKFRSLNLNAAYIDEANQVSEEAFTLLQGRLRGRAWRKLFVTSNPNGHDFIYRWFYQKAHFKTEEAKSQYLLVRAPSTENVHLPEGYIASLLEVWSEDRIKREIEGSFDAFAGMVYSEFRRDVHVIKPFRIPDHWPRYIGIDHGYRNPAAWVWVAVGEDGELYVYKEFYQSGWLINEIIAGKKYDGKLVDPGALAISGKDKIQYAVIDPSTRNRRGTNGESDFDEYTRLLPKEFPIGMANNEKALGIDRVKTYLKVSPKTNRPNIYFFEDCHNVLEEITQYKYQELRPGQENKISAKEEPYKVNDHALDALRYVVMLMPEPAKGFDDPKKGMSHSQLGFYEGIQKLKKPGPKDPLSIL